MPKLFNRDGDISEFLWIKSEVIDPNHPTLLPVTLPSIENILTTGQSVGLWFEPEDEPETFSSALYAKVSTIAIHFPKFTDGRGFSISKLLRQRWHFTGDILAVGELVVDQVYYLHRCGFSHVVLPDHITRETFHQCATAFSHHYQSV